jgi:hypothetical protein
MTAAKKPNKASLTSSSPVGSGSGGPRSVQDAKLVHLALVSYTDQRGQRITQLAVVGENNVHLLEGKLLGFSPLQTPQGVASDWLRDGIFELLKKDE